MSKITLEYGCGVKSTLKGDISLKDVQKYMIKKKIVLFLVQNQVIDFSKVLFAKEEQEAKEK